jgi:hypothetical protein
MGRWRARLGLGAVVAALAVAPALASGPALAVAPALASGPALAGTAAGVSASLASADPGTLQVSPPAVQVSQATTLTVSFAAPADPPSPYLTVTLTMPPGWTAAAPLPDPACQDAGCQLVSASSTQIVVVMRLYYTTTFTLDVPATAPGSAGPASFTATEQFRSSPPVTLQATAPPVSVSCLPDQAGTVTVNPQSVSAASSTTLSFSYTAGSCALGPGGSVSVMVPPGWTAPDTISGTHGFVASAGGLVAVSGPVITVPAANLGPGTVVSFEYEAAQAPGSPGSSTFIATEESGPGGPAQDLASPPVVVVTPSGVTTTTPPPPPPPNGGAGSMTVTPGRVTTAHRSTLRFTYTAAQAGLSRSGGITIEVPAGWTVPAGRPGQAGYVSASRGLLAVSGRRITLTGVTLGPGQQVSITYAAATAPGTASLATFTTTEQPDRTATLAALRMSPEVTVALPAGTRGRMSDWLPILLVVTGLVLAAATAGLLAFRPLRRGGHPAPGENVRAVPRSGPPVSVTVRDTGSRPALTVRIEPHAGATVTTIEERQP